MSKTVYLVTLIKEQLLNTVPILPERLASIKTRWIGGDIRILEEVDSTNTYAKSLLREGIKSGTVVIAESQTAGRGRLGRLWQSEKYANLTFSVIVLNVMAESAGVLPLAVGLAVAEALDDVTGLSFACKWPNDILHDGRKICGILCESIAEPDGKLSIIIGIGVNVNQQSFAPEIADRATSLSLTAHKEFDRPAVLSVILKHLELELDNLFDEGAPNIIARWKQHAPMLGNEISINQQDIKVNGIALDIAPNGSLIVQAGNKRISVLAGDVTIVKKK
ncbi:MAG TPA: biotin--[acetyl-CoA-carboxylase] ligase [Bacteroidota bacterium]|nr:biotin--[acetyl-CoA-carboxylase] ligase [Bacteroidota bacterium]